jgi:hypothetical protein
MRCRAFTSSSFRAQAKRRARVNRSAIPIEAAGQTYHYARGAFYLDQPDGTCQTAPTPLSVVVPELPLGAVQVSLSDGSVAYQFNGVYSADENGTEITQYQTFMPR